MRGLFQCKFCKDVKWQPIYWFDAQRFSTAVKFRGMEEAYRHALAHKKRIRNVIVAIQLLSQELSAAMEWSDNEEVKPKVEKRKVGRPRKEKDNG